MRPLPLPAVPKTRADESPPAHSLRNSLVKELGVAATASVAGGFGIVFAFCLVGANV